MKALDLQAAAGVWGVLFGSRCHSACLSKFNQADDILFLEWEV